MNNQPAIFRNPITIEAEHAPPAVGMPSSMTRVDTPVKATIGHGVWMQKDCIQACPVTFYATGLRDQLGDCLSISVRTDFTALGPDTFGMISFTLTADNARFLINALTAQLDLLKLEDAGGG